MILFVNVNLTAAFMQEIMLWAITKTGSMIKALGREIFWSSSPATQAQMLIDSEIG